MNLINKKLLQQKIHSFEFPSPEKLVKAKSLLEGWQKALKDSDLEKTKEKSVQGKFLSTFFEDILGYSDVTTGNEEYTLIQHPRIENDSKEPDGSLGWFTKDKKITKAVIELKDAKTQLDKKQNRGSEKLTPVEQAYLYSTKYGGCNWIIVSNFKEIRVYNKHKTQEYYEKFDVMDLTQDSELKRFYFLLSQQNLISKDKESIIDILAQDTTEAEQDITKKFYAQYKQIRLELLGHLTANNPNVSKEVLIEKTQKLLDRFIFTLFCEDTSTLLPLNLVKNTYERAINSLSPSDERVWTEFKGLFLAIDKGNDRVKPPINAYNGGLFAFDEVLDNLSIKDTFWINLMHLAEYDFETDLNVNILGHIFEQSISDLEEIKMKFLNVYENTNNGDIITTPQDLFVEKKGRRKKEGIFYTPEYITRYIVENTIGKYLEEHPDKLETIKILDPACGSGAFLNQAHSYLVKEYTNRYEALINEKLEKGESITLFDHNPAENNRKILLNNLYGVDLNQESVEITKLALWLKTARSTEPLQNLDKNIKNGNSLIDDPEIAGKKAFNWNNEFNEIMGNGGFDVIIGNPPYIKEYVNKLAFNGLKNKPYYQGKMDIWTYFGCIAIDLLKEGGYLSFIAPNNWVTNTGASIFRNKILSEGQIVSYFDFGDFKVFKDAGIQTMIFVFKKTPVKEKFTSIYSKVLNKHITDDVAELALTAGNLNSSSDIRTFSAEVDIKKTQNKNLDFLDKSSELLLEKISIKSNFKLQEKEVAQGIVGAPDECFILKDINQFSSSEREFIKVYYTNVHRYSKENSNQYIIYLSSKNFSQHKLEDFSNLYSHFQKHKDVLIEAKKKYETPNKPYYYLHREREEKFFQDGPKVVCGIRVSKPSFFYTESKYYGSRALNFIVTDRINLKYLTGILNSDISYFWLKNKGKQLGDLLQVDKTPLLSLPIVQDRSQEDLIAELVDKIQALEIKNSALKDAMYDFIKNEFGITLESTLGQHINLLGWNEFVEILEKKRINLDIDKKQELFSWFRARQTEFSELLSQINSINNEINQHVYRIYNLSEEDIKIIEDSLAIT